jgi:hypothetical protein
VREKSDSLASLVKKIDERVNEAAGRQKGPELGTYLIFPNNADGLDQQLRTLAAHETLQRVSIGIGAVPDAYNLSRDADITVVIYEVGRRRNAVSANFALRWRDLDEKQSAAILEALGKVLPK